MHRSLFRSFAALLLAVGLVSVFGWNQWNHRPSSLLAGLPYLVVAASCLTVVVYLSLKAQ